MTTEENTDFTRDINLDPSVLKGLFEIKFDEAEWRGAIRVNADGERTMIATGPKHRVMFIEGSHGLRQLSITSPDEPFYNIVIDQKYGVAEEFFIGDWAECPPIERQLDIARSVPIFPNVRVPYGYVRDGKVVLVLFSGENLVTDNGNVIPGATATYLLGGQTYPEELVMYIPMSLEKVVEWSNNFWAMVRNGTFVRMSDRLNKLDTYFSSGGSGSARLSIEGDSDGQTPVIPNYGVYELCDIRDNPTNKLSGETAVTKVYRNSGKGWFC